MKKMIFISIFFITLTGCTTTYKISESRSPEKFYEKFTSAVENRIVHVTLVNDSTIFTSDKNKIVKDTLYRIKETRTIWYYKVPTEQIKDIDYLSNDYKTADITLKNGEKFKGENLSLASDTSTFRGTNVSVIKSLICPISDIRSIEYKNHWKGVIPGILGGILLGGFLGGTGWFIHPTDGGNQSTFAQGEAILVGAYSGLIIGAALGYLIGFNIEYQFER